MSSCGTCSGNGAAIVANSQSLYNNLPGQYHGVMTTLLKALEQVDMRMRVEAYKPDWRPSNFRTRITEYRKMPRGTEVVSRATPLYFENNEEYSSSFVVPGIEGGICEGGTLCAEPEANKVPGNSYQTFTWSMRETAFETPTFCLKDLAFFENGMETLTAFLQNVERIPAMFYDNHIRNYLWEMGEKYVLGATDYGLLWNSPDRVSKRIAPNLNDYLTYAPSGTGDVGTPKLEAFPFIEHLVEDLIGEEASDFRIQGKSGVMMCGTKEDILSFIYNNYSDGVIPFIQGGQGASLFDMRVVEKFPFAFKTDKKWFRGDFDSNGEFYRIPAKIYVPENGGLTLRTNPEWITARYGVITFMTSNPFVYRTFEAFPSVPGQVPPEATRYLRPSFQWVPLTEKCNYSRGLVGWRAEEEFGFQPTGEKVIHVIYARDELSAYIREARVGAVIDAVVPLRAEIPETCSTPQVLSCCAAPGAVVDSVDYKDTGYTVTYSSSIQDLHDIDLADLASGPIEAKFATIKGVFDVIIVSANTAGTLITFYVDPTQHTGGHFCCEDQLLGFVASDPVTGDCHVLIDGGLRPDPFDPTVFHVALGKALNASESDDVTVWFDNGCGSVTSATVELTTLNNGTRRATLTVTPADFPNGVPCADAVSICASDTSGCDSCATIAAAEACSADTVTAIPL